ncbi:MAG: alanine racemase [Planctomycetes bacterium]|nr:alanine racemase [Planctomycetota bacterium]MCL4730330.1 alanine racemase [Planctomycetota bacterium]
MDLREIPTPALVLDLPRLRANAAFMAGRAAQLGVRLRPHLKTAKCAEVARLATRGQFGGITVSTLAEAAFFLGHGFADLTLAVELPPTKVAPVLDLVRHGARMTVLVDSPESAAALRDACAAAELPHPVRALVEVDCGDRRGGLPAESPALVSLARLLHGARNLELAGVLTHAGHSYACAGVPEIVAVAEQERAAAVAAAARLREAGLPCDTVSVGSTPTATHARDLRGVTEMRPGVYLLGDLDQVGLASMGRDRVAATVLATVIGHYPARNTLLVDAGGLALSKDTSAQRHGPRIGYGLVLDMPGRELEGLYVYRTNQEHGHVTADAPLPYDRLPIGSRVRVMPNHICMTAAAYDCFHVVEGDTTVVAQWPRVNGW